LLDSIKIESHLISLGFKSLENQSEKRKVDGFISSNLVTTVYVKRDPDDPLNPKTKLPLVIHDCHEGNLKQVLSEKRGVLTGKKLHYFNSNLKGFNKKLNGGAEEEAFGLHLNIADNQALEQLISALHNEENNNVNPGIETSDVDLKRQVEELVLQSIKTRRGQPAFRNSLLDAFDGTCCITGCKVDAVLEAAHIVPHGEETNYSVTNGLLLRADIHTLFDLELLSINVAGLVQIDESLKSSNYQKYDGINIMKGILPPAMVENLRNRNNVDLIVPKLIDLVNLEHSWDIIINFKIEVRSDLSINLN
jgi:hypothetical protein